MNILRILTLLELMADEKNIHPLAVVEEGAIIKNGVVIEPYAVVRKNVVLEEKVVVKSHAYVDGYTTIGPHTTIYPGACIGTKTQDLKFRGEKTFVTIGAHCEIREYVTINSSCQENSAVTVGDNCLIMAYCHIAHNCQVGNNVIMSNNATLAGHVTVEDFAIIGGMTPIHQFARVGAHAMVGGMSRITHDIPPYLIGGDIPFRFGGLNIVGLKRRGIPLSTRQELSRAFTILFRRGLKLNDALERIENELKPLPEILHLIQFCRTSTRGLMMQHPSLAMASQEIQEEQEEVEELTSGKSSR